MASGSQIGIGIWGAGWVAGAHAAAYQSTPGCEIVAIGSRRRESAASLASANGLDCRIYTDYADFLSDPDLDAVSICTPNGLHAQNAVDGARAGKHMFIEKPVALTPEDLAGMREAVCAAGVVTSVGFVSRGVPLVRRMHEIVQSGALGEIYMIGADYWHSRLGRPDYYKTAEEAGNAYMVGGVHAVDAVRFITGLDITAVCAASTQIGSAAAEGYEMHAVDSLLVTYSNGAVGRVSAAIHGHMPYQVNLDILGDRGVIRNERVFTGENAEGDPFTVLGEQGLDSGSVDDHAFPYLMREFVECISTGSQTRVSLENAVNTHEVGFAVDISKRRGEWVPLPLS